MKGVIIMAILESDFLDWQSLTDQSGGKVSDNTISWSQAEIPALAELPSGAAGTIDFSIQLKPQAAIDISKAYQITSYVKYSVLGKSAGGESQSNTIVSKINSDLSLSEQLRYFSDDNIAVGSGPLPPKVGQATSLKVYWTINNSLHELGSLTVSVILPDGVGWDGKNNSSIGSLVYDNVANKVTWLIGSLPVTVAKATADFNISLIPQESDRNKIKVILNDTAVTALDTVTGTPMSKTLKAKTSKLEDDTMVSGDGVVQ
jgi:hypothetical protein